MKREWMCVWALAAALPGSAMEQRAASYTNEDLEHLTSRRGETGVRSTPAFNAPEPVRTRPGEQRGEAYWRGEADKLRAGLQKLQAQLDWARGRLAKAQRAARDAAFRSARSSTTARAPSGGSHALSELEEQIRGIELEIRAREGNLEERARRAGALPGWLR